MRFIYPDPWDDKLKVGGKHVKNEYVKHYHRMKVIFGRDKNTGECVAFRNGKVMTFELKRPTYEECEETAEKVLDTFHRMAMEGTKLDG